MREKDEKAKVARELPVESRGLQRRSKRGVNTAVPTATPRWCKYWECAVWRPPTVNGEYN